MPWKPSEPGERPTLGWVAVEFAESLLAAPETEDYKELELTVEAVEFLLALYELDPESGRRIVTRAALSRPRGWGKSPTAGIVGIFEALGGACPAGWDANGQPVGMPWRRIKKPFVHLFGVSIDQTENAWDPIRDLIRAEQGDSPLWDEFPGLEPLQDVIFLPGGGAIAKRTSSATTVKGGKPICVLLDQTEEYTTSNGGIAVAKTAIDNATKRSGLVLETPNAFVPGRDTQAERTAAAAAEVMSGSSRLKRGFLWDHREAPADTDLSDEESLTYGLRYAYGCSSDHPDGCVLHTPPCPPGWASIASALNRVWQPDADEQESRANFLNQITHASDAFVSQPEWAGCLAAEKLVLDKDVITMGFDGSRAKAKGKPDATALIGCRIRDGHLFELGVWEAPELPSTWDKWEPPIVEIEAAVANAFKRYKVARFYCDPAKDWRSHVNSWEAKYSGKLFQPEGAKRQPQVQHPFEWWMTGGRAVYVERAVEALYAGIAKQDVTQSGAYGLTRHMLNARRRLSHGKLALGKESSYSQKKIDAAVAAVLAYQGCLDAISAGVMMRPASKASYQPKRLY